MEETALSQLSALAQPHRLSVFRLLMRRYPQALPAGEIAGITGLAPSTLSVHLATLRNSGLVTQSRAGTSMRYAVLPDAAERLVAYLVEECCRSRPDICLTRSALGTRDAAMTHRKYNVLFICTGNSARSIFAEALLRSEAGDRFTVYSAGTRPSSELNPIALDMLRAKGHPVADLRAKHVSEYQSSGAPRFDFVFTVCDRAANEDCPAWPGQPISAHWGQPDPVKATGTEAERRLAFQQVYGALRNRIRAFAALPVAALDRATLQTRVDEIGRTEEEAQ